ncbi:type II toxin-antitoxin system PemK/MazF family toxin (plasmid) [Pontibacillus sp. ALD_SL1]|uniref:type II toxin-antitoxin system PemK/MazF family toxin n=1 Tax=Pontibacillus sp. ALD_SL1 TaxID=2777185 RepID=UPI001A97C674|nr:type II toxin-antitoxin system PemK/MazF family toxin [Pontibacillus sp. ALD_SL1]QST02959.1 type II toxin-antitoxin system PemK/MazF family toxin [Pontibacillus sp. ALD_SL1]
MNIGEIYFYCFSNVVGREQNGRRPVLVIRVDEEEVVVACLSTKIKSSLPVHVPIPKRDTGLSHDTVVLMEQLQSLPKCAFHKQKPISTLKNPAVFTKVQRGLEVSLGF